MKKKIIIGAVILVVIVGIVLGFTVFNRSNNNNEQYKKEAVNRGDIEALVITTGSLNPVTIVEVGSQVSGRISRLYADFNSEVKEGQVIAELDQSLFLTRVQQSKANHESAKASLEKAKVTLENMKRKYDRALDLLKKELISFEEKETAETQYYTAKADVQSSEARLEQAKSQLDSSNVDLAYTIIKSPIDGIVISRDVNVGQTVAASFQAPVLFQIANDLSKMQVECSVDEADIGKIKEGQKVKFTVDAFPNDAFAGKVTQVRYSPEVIQNVVTYTTIVEVDNPEMKLRPGMTATVSVVTGEAKNALRVPNAALRFNPQLSPEEMRKIYDEMRQEMMARRGGTAPSGRSNGERSSQTEGGPSSQRRSQSPGGMGSAEAGGRMSQFSRIWIEDDKGRLRPIFVKQGVTDNTYTEIVWGNLKEGQQVITGEIGSSRVRFRGGMPFMRRR
ncbi:MAG: efflux RND transporter periplasmic adaptor subunit [Candidatus Aminicenantes bacterium]|nr:efflux RND transporter periplasmic adaptor subunit [Candidatus Aminicenantes bacterium]